MIFGRIQLAISLFLVSASFLAGHEWRDRKADNELFLKDAEIASLYLQAQTAATVASEKARELERATIERTALALEADVLRNQERQVIEKIVNREVVRYVSNPAAGFVLLPPDWVRIHDLAASGTFGLPQTADTPRLPDAIPSPVADSDAIAVVAENYTTCREITGQLEALQAWVRVAF